MKKIEILGMGCAKCNTLEEVSKKAADELGIDYKIEKVSDVKAIMAYGVMTTPALVVDGEVKVAGKVPSLEDVKKFIGN